MNQNRWRSAAERARRVGGSKTQAKSPRVVPLNVLRLTEAQRLSFDSCVERRQKSTGQTAQDARSDVTTWILDGLFRLVAELGNRTRKDVRK